MRRKIPSEMHKSTHDFALIFFLSSLEHHEKDEGP